MYIKNINTQNKYKFNNSCKIQNKSYFVTGKNCDNITFRQANIPELKQQSYNFMSSYIKRFFTEIGEYRKEGDKILQPSGIPLKTLYSVAKNEIQKMQKFPKERILLIITGRIGGGKTTYVEKNNLQKIFYTPDADEIKQLLPGYKENGSEYVHKASCTINSANLSEALKKGINTVVQTSTTIDNLYDIIDEARDYKYNDIIMVHIDTSEETAIKRSQERGELTGRKIDPDIIRERKYIDDIVPTFQTPLKGLSHLVVYNNDGDYLIKVKDIDLSIPQAVYTYITEISE